ncbi:MAG: hypothetical protein LAT54_10595 [Cryomorphaceae bacterium]|nr:hypothetical protein [Cryomorphaceae bacterium]
MFISIILWGCKTKAPQNENTQQINIKDAQETLDNKRQEKKERCLPILRASQHEEEYPKTNMITKANIERGCLNISFDYSGCEKTHAHVYYERIENTNPQELQLFVGVKEAGDCDMLLTDSGSFNLHDLEGHTAGKVILRIDGYDQPLTHIYTAE